MYSKTTTDLTWRDVESIMPRAKAAENQTCIEFLAPMYEDKLQIFMLNANRREAFEKLGCRAGVITRGDLAMTNDGTYAHNYHLLTQAMFDESNKRQLGIAYAVAHAALPSMDGDTHQKALDTQGLKLFLDTHRFKNLVLASSSVPRILRPPVLGMIVALGENIQSKHLFRDAGTDLAIFIASLKTLGATVGPWPTASLIMGGHLAELGLETFPSWKEIDKMPKNTPEEREIFVKMMQARAAGQALALPLKLMDGLSSRIKTMLDKLESPSKTRGLLLASPSHFLSPSTSYSPMLFAPKPMPKRDFSLLSPTQTLTNPLSNGRGSDGLNKLVSPLSWQGSKHYQGVESPNKALGSLSVQRTYEPRFLGSRFPDKPMPNAWERLQAPQSNVGYSVHSLPDHTLPGANTSLLQPLSAAPRAQLSRLSNFSMFSSSTGQAQSLRLSTLASSSLTSTGWDKMRASGSLSSGVFK